MNDSVAAGGCDWLINRNEIEELKKQKTHTKNMLYRACVRRAQGVGPCMLCATLPVDVDGGHSTGLGWYERKKKTENRLSVYFDS